MSNKIIAKFTMSEIANQADGARRVRMIPVMSGSEENKSFSKWTPSGNLELWVTNPDADFQFGEYYVTLEHIPNESVSL